MADNQINLILKLILAGDFEKAASLLRGLVVETTELEKAANKAGGTENNVAKEKLSNLEKIRRALKETQEAQKLLTESASAEDEAAAFELLVEARKKLSKVVDEANKTEETGNKKKLADIRQLQQQLQVLTEKQKQLQQAVKGGDTGKGAELSSVTAQVGSLQAKITALRTGQQQLTQSSQAVQSSFQQTVTLAEGLSGKFQALTQVTPALSQGFNGVGGSLINVAKGLGPVGLAVGAAVAAFSLGSSAAIKFGEDTAFAAKTQLAIQRSTGTSASFIGALTTIIKSYGGEVQNVQELLLQTGSVINTAISNPVGESAERFNKLGIEVRDAAGKAKSIEQVLREIDKVASSTALTTEQLTIVSGIFGEEASKQFLDQVGNFTKIEERLKKTGAIISDELTELSRKYNEAGQLIQAQTDGITFSLGGEILPYLLDIRQYASDAIAAVDPEDLNGIKAIIGDIGGVLKTLATTSVDFGSTAINIIGNLATGFDALLNPIDSVKAILGIYPAVTDKAEGSQQKLTKAFVSGTFAAEELSKRINQLANDQKFLGDITATIADTQILAVQQRLRQGLIDEQTAADEISRLEKRKVDQKAGFEEDKLKKVTKSLDEEIKRRQDAAKQEDKILQDITARKQQAQKELTKIKEEAFQSEVALESFAGKSKQGEEELRKEKEKNATLISLAQQRFNQLNRAEQEATINSQKASKDLADLKAGTNLAILVDEKKLKDDVLKLRNDLQSATLGLEQSRLAKRRQTDEEIKKSEQSIVVARDKSIRDINVLEANALKELQAKILAGSVSRTQAEQEALAIKLKFDKDRLLSENDALIKINGLNGASEEVKTKLKQDAVTRRQSIDKQEFDQGVKLAQDAANARKALLDAESAQRQADINKQKSAILEISDEKLKAIAQQQLEISIAKNVVAEAEKKIQLEKDALEVLKKQGASKEELKKAEESINVAISEGTVARAEQIALETKQAKDRLKAIDDERAADRKRVDDKIAGLNQVKSGEDAINDRIEHQADRQNSLTDAIDKTAGKVVGLKQTFDATNASIEETQQRIIDLRADADSIRFSNILAFPGQQAVAKSFEETAEALEKILGERIGKANLEAFKQREAAELAERRKGAEQALDIVKDFEDEANQIREDSLEKRKDLKQQIIDNATQEATEVAQIKIDNQKELDEFDQEQKDRELERADQQHESLLEKEASFQANLAETKNKAAEEQLDKERDAILKRADLESQIADLIASKKGAKPDEIAKIEAKIKELQGQIKGVDEAEKSRIEREKKRQDEIAKAQQEASEKIKGAKSADEVTQIEKELAIQLDGINEKFANEEKFEADLAKLKDKASKETIEALRKNFEAQQALVDKSVNDRIAAEQRQADLAEQARKKAADKEKADIETRRNDLLAAQAKELSDRATAFEEKQKQLEAALTKEREDYKKHIDELRTKTAESLAEIAKSFTDGGTAAEKFFKDFAASAGLTGKAIDDILKKLKAFKDQVASDSQQTDSASGTPSSGNAGTPSTASNSSPFSSPGSNPNNTAGQIGTPSAPPAPSGKGIVEQTKSDKQGNQPTGVTKGEPKTGQQSPGDASPSSASDANSFRKSVIDLRKNFEKNVEGNTRKDGSLIRNKKTDPIIQKLYENLTSILKSYFTSAGLDLSKVGASETNFLFSTITELRRNTYKEAIETIIQFVESQGGQGQGDTSKGDSKTEINNVGVDPGSSGLSGAGAGSGNGDKGNDGFGDKGKPTVPPTTPPPSGRNSTDQEKAFFAGRAEDAANKGGGDEEAFKEGQAIIGPDSAINPAARPKTNTTITTTEPPSSPPSAPAGAQINNQPTFAPTFAPVINLKLETKGSEADVNKQINQLNAALNDVSNQSSEQLMNTLTQRLVGKLEQIFR